MLAWVVSSLPQEAEMKKSFFDKLMRKVQLSLTWMLPFA